jgi:hypothetical protein
MLTAVIRRWKKMLTVVIERRKKMLTVVIKIKKMMLTVVIEKKREDVNSCHRNKIGRPKPTDGNRTTSALLKEGLDSE